MTTKSAAPEAPPPLSGGSAVTPTWLTFDNAKWVIGALAIPAFLGFASYQYEKISANRVAEESRYKLYTELLSRREEADTGVRRGVFEKVLGSYLNPTQGDIEQKAVALELLALNFHESVNLSPLFWQLDRQIAAEPPKLQQEHFAHLRRIAGNVKDRQVEVLEVSGVKRDGTISFDEIATAPPLVDEDLSFEDPDTRQAERTRKRHFTVEVVEHDPALRRLLVRVHDGRKQWVFWVDPFDFPLVDFARISKSERFAVILRSYTADSAQLSFLYFPSSRSGAKDKPFIDDVLSDLLAAKSK
jgi:hypothetical protein